MDEEDLVDEFWFFLIFRAQMSQVPPSSLDKDSTALLRERFYRIRYLKFNQEAFNFPQGKLHLVHFSISDRTQSDTKFFGISKRLPGRIAP